MLKLRQPDIAKNVGVSFQTIQKYETGQIQLSLVMFCKLCWTLGIDAAAELNLLLREAGK
jgi:predicted transcriptional regulator